MFTDTTPFTIAGIFLALLLAIWSIETLQQPNPEPSGPVYTFSDGSSWQTIAAAPR